MTEKELLQSMSAAGEIVDCELDRILPQATGEAAELYEAMRYSLFAGGKRLRPFLVFQGAALAGMDMAGVLPTACAVEVIHVSSLIHDDLPCMDDDDYRRGKLTSHKVYGEAMALLAGDALMMLGFDLAASNAVLPDVTPERALMSLHELHKGVGYGGMVGGQAVDIRESGNRISMNKLVYIHRHKTGAFIQTSLKCGAILGGLDSTRLEKIAEFGACMGLAFQIMDDILDINGDPEVTGKATGSDDRKRKATYPSLLGMEETKRELRTTVEQGHEILKQIGPGCEPLHALLDYAAARDK